MPIRIDRLARLEAVIFMACMTAGRKTHQLIKPIDYPVGGIPLAGARKLRISPSTAGTHVESLYRKLGVSTRAAAALIASKRGLVN
jgi:hypothetical protein